MCTHSRYIYNKYINRSILVPCGKCPSCQQAKANLRALRIRNHNQDAHNLSLFVTLTYSNDFVPYVKSSDLFNLSPIMENAVNIPVFRDKGIKVTSHHEVGSFLSSECRPYCHNIPELRRKKGCTGIILWSDVQKFIKRLRIYLQRYFNYHEKISYIAVGEYGKHTYRPHFHLLIYFPKASLEDVRPFIIKAWPFGDMQRANKRIQIAIDASSYLASYLAKSANLPKIFESPAFRQKHSHSLHFGVGSSAFQLASILEKVDRGDCSYNREIFKDGKPVLVALPIPQYVIGRFFPKFKGYSSFAPDEIHELLRLPRQLWNKKGRYLGDIFIRNGSKVIELLNRVTQFLPSELCYNYDDYHKFVVHLRNCVDYYIKTTGKTIYDYAIDYNRVWTTRSSYVLKHSYDNVTSFADFYENAVDFVHNIYIAPTLRTDVFYEINPNARSMVVRTGEKLSDMYLKKEQIKDTNSFILSELDEEF